ncbi:MAG: signal recognition particle-docking protein FtsY [Porticoccaceae bacterium]|nr:signal recognition particle-docking protein FtsY [Porticoccaceae bacterium]
MKFFSRKNNTEKPDNDSAQKKGSISSRLRNALKRTRSGLEDIFAGKREINTEFLEDLESSLIMADIGAQMTDEIIQSLTQSLNRNELKDIDSVKQALRTFLISSLKANVAGKNISNSEKPHVIFVVGVNGVGKTTTIGKLANNFKKEGKRILLAAGDTYRAAAVEQLQIWGDRIDVPVIAQQTGADSASVIYDAIESARAKDIDVVIADTAGRLHNKDNLMDELAKIKRVASKLSDNAPHEVLLVLDAATGQNALSQMSEFHKAVDVTGLVLTKLDGTAKGGILISLAKQFPVDIKYIGVGEGIDDLKVFEAELFVDALIDF